MTRFLVWKKGDILSMLNSMEINRVKSLNSKLQFRNFHLQNDKKLYHYHYINTHSITSLRVCQGYQSGEWCFDHLLCDRRIFTPQGWTPDYSCSPRLNGDNRSPITSINRYLDISYLVINIFIDQTLEHSISRLLISFSLQL